MQQYAIRKRGETKSPHPEGVEKGIRLDRQPSHYYTIQYQGSDYTLYLRQEDTPAIHLI